MNGPESLGWLQARITALRRLHGYTQEGAAEKAGMSYKHYQAVEAGRRRDLRFSTLQRIASGYGLRVHELLAPRIPPSGLRNLRPKSPRARGQNTKA